MMAAVYSLGFFEEEKNHGIACDYEEMHVSMF